MNSQSGRTRTRLLARTPVRLAAALVGVLAVGACAQTPAQTLPQQSTTSQLTAPPTGSGSTSSAGSTPTASTDATCPEPPSGFVRRAPGDVPTVALTFDDGPAAADMEIVKVLARYDVKATFFETGENVQANPDIVKAIVAGGNLVSDHSWEHQYPVAVDGGWTISYLTSQFKRTDDAITAITGEPVCFFRPPGGYTDNVLKATAKVRMTSVMWSIDTEDWRQPSKTTSAATKAIVNKATTIGTQAHPVVLMHSGKASREPDSVVGRYRGNTVAALASVIEWYQAKGFTFVRMDGVS
jgi:peptidoglycan-N-acetylglucosamine deacetylase